MVAVHELRDYQVWHQHYDDPESGLSWRLRTVQGYLREALDTRPGPIRVLSLCAGDGRDVLDVLTERDDRDRVSATLVELHPQIAEAARERAVAARLPRVHVRTADAARPDHYADAVPADVVLLVGIFGNISEQDIQATVRAAPQLCTSGATLLWSRGRNRGDLNDTIRGWFAEAGFAELDYATHDSDSRPALGAMRYRGQAEPLVAGQQLFTFIR